jgi:O-antigen/teichoic acid export membrane protein
VVRCARTAGAHFRRIRLISLRNLPEVVIGRFRHLGREFLWITLGQAASVIGVLVGVRLLTELLPPAEYGRLALGMTVASLVNQVVLGPLSGGTTRFFSAAREVGELGEYLGAVRRLAVNATLVILAVTAAVATGLPLFGQRDWVMLTAAAFAFGLISGYNSLLNGMQNAARQRAVVALHQALESWGRFLVAAALVVWLGATSTVAIVGYIVAMIAIVASQLRFLARVVRSSPQITTAISPLQVGALAWPKMILNYSWPFAIWGIFTWAQVASERWALNAHGSVQLVGLYAVLYQIGYYPIFTATGLLAQLVQPAMFQRAGDASSSHRMGQVYQITWYLTGITLGLTILGVAAAGVLHNLIFRLLVAQQYASVAWLLPWMVLASGLYAVAQVAVIGPLSSRESKILMWPKVSCAVLGIGLNWLGAARFGIPGVVGAGVVFGAVYLTWILGIVVKQHRTISSAMPPLTAAKVFPT